MPIAPQRSLTRLDPETVGRLHQIRALGAGPRRAGHRRRLVLYALLLVAAA